MSANRFPQLVALIVGAFFLLSGLWALLAPEAFVKTAASFNPYNQHFVQDIGAFQIGLGAVLLLVLVSSVDGLTAALLGVAIGSTAHVVSHVVGRDLGGRPTTDIPFFAIVTVLLFAAAVVQRRSSDPSPRR